MFRTRIKSILKGLEDFSRVRNGHSDWREALGVVYNTNK